MVTVGNRLGLATVLMRFIGRGFVVRTYQGKNLGHSRAKKTPSGRRQRVVGQAAQYEQAPAPALAFKGEVLCQWPAVYSVPIQYPCLEGCLGPGQGTGNYGVFLWPGKGKH